MNEIIVGVIVGVATYVLGFVAEKWIDKRELKRSLIEPSFNDFQIYAYYIRNVWRDEQRSLLSKIRDLQKNANPSNDENDKLRKFKNAFENNFNNARKNINSKVDVLISSCLKINASTLISNINEVHDDIREAIMDYDKFYLEGGKSLMDYNKYFDGFSSNEKVIKMNNEYFFEISRIKCSDLKFFRQ